MTIKEVEKKIQKTNETIKNLSKKIEILSLETEKKDAIRADDITRYKELADQAAENEKEIARACEKYFYNNILLQVLIENKKALVFSEGCKLLYNFCFEFDGKQYGEKTSEKIRTKMRENGFAFYFEGYSTKNHVNIALLDKNGCCYGSDYVCGYSRIPGTNLGGCFVTAENRLTFCACEAVSYNHFVEDPEKRAKDIIKAYRKIEKAENELDKLHKEYSSLIPEKGLPHVEYFKHLAIRF